MLTGEGCCVPARHWPSNNKGDLNIMDTNQLIVNKIHAVHEPSAMRLGLDRMEEDKLMLAFGRWAEGQIKKWIDTPKACCFS